MTLDTQEVLIIQNYLKFSSLRPEKACIKC